MTNLWRGLALVLAFGLLVWAGMLWFASPVVERRAALPEPAPGAPDVLLVVLDTVRAQNLATYGYERPTSPVLDGLAREGVLFLDATSPSTWSLASHASLFTGRYPSGHDAHMEHRFLGVDHPTIAETLGTAGYQTYSFTSNWWITDRVGLTRGFQHEKRLLPAGEPEEGRLLDKGGRAVAEHFEQWARERPVHARPFFVFLNFIEAHFPYHELPYEYLTRFTGQPLLALRDVSLEVRNVQFGGEVSDLEVALRDSRDMYDGGVLYSDHLLGRVVEALRQRGTLDRTVLVVVADHGELLGEKGDYFGHGPSLYQEEVGVPLLLRYPPRVPAGERVSTPVSTVGIFATILDLIDVPPPPDLHVGSLAPVIRGAPQQGPVLAERFRAEKMGLKLDRAGDPMLQSDVRYRLYRDGHWKLVETSAGQVYLYDLATDPREQRSLADSRAEDLARLRAGLEESVAELGLHAIDAELDLDETTQLDAETLGRLKSLGYLE